MKNVFYLFIFLSCAVCAQAPSASFAGMDTDSSWFELTKPEFNCEKSDFGIARFGNGYVFASTRTSGYTIRFNSSEDESPLLDLYFIQSIGNGFSEPVSFSSSINTLADNEGPMTATRDGHLLIFTSNEAKTKRLILQESHLNKSRWESATVLPFCADGFSYVHPNLAFNDSVLFFSSDRPGGFGGMDIYYSRRMNGTWSEPVNAGKAINTGFDEKYPFCAPNGILYFSSSRSGVDLDLFVIRTQDTADSKALKLPPPVNSPADDFGFYISDDGRGGFFSSNRGNEKTDDDIYHFRYRWPEPPDTDTILPVQLCYEFFEEATARTGDSILMKYSWRFSDGDVFYGPTVQKCFDTTGVYTIRLAVRDSSGGDVVISETEYEFEIVQPNFISFHSPDTVAALNNFTTGISLSEGDGYEILQVYFDFGNGYTARSSAATLHYHHAGIYYPKVYLLIKNKETGATESRCVTKKIVVI